VPHPPVLGGGAHSLAREGLGESQFRRGDRHCGTLYIYHTLCILLTVIREKKIISSKMMLGKFLAPNVSYNTLLSNESKSLYSGCSLAPFPPYCRIIHPSPPPFPPTVFVESLPHLSKTLLCSINSWWGGGYTCSAILPRETTGFS
jgi:hypothetical protein